MREFLEALRKLILESDSVALATVLFTAVSASALCGFWGGRIFQKLFGKPPLPAPSTKPDPLPIDVGCPQRLEEANHEIARLQDEMISNQAIIDTMLEHEGQIWRLHEPEPPVGYKSPSTSHAKIILVANNKGGVGKTTLVMYMAAYFAGLGKRVLAVDLDPQSSLTRAMLEVGGIHVPTGQAHRLAFANQLLSDRGPEHWSPEVLIGQLAGVHLVTCDQTLESHEAKLQLRWLALGGRPDIRYFLAQSLLSEKVQNAQDGYHVVLIDAPPRLSLGSINALTASTHLLVPTKLDKISAETVGTYLDLVTGLKDGANAFPGLNEDLKLAGIVGTMTYDRPLSEEVSASEKEALAVVNKGLQNWKGEPYIFKHDVLDLETVRHAAGIKLVKTGKAPTMFDELGAELADRIGL